MRAIVVAIQSFDKAAHRVHRETPLPDFRRWRETLKSVEHVSAMRPIVPAVIARDDADDSVSAAEMTASGFQLARVQPCLDDQLRRRRARGRRTGRRDRLTLWQSGFSSDPAVLGQRIQIGDTPHIVVGVMPEGFRFPMNQRLWTPPLEPIPSVRCVRDVQTPSLCATRSWSDAGTRAGRSHHVRLLPRYRRRNDRTARTARRRRSPLAFSPTVNRNSWLAGVIFLLWVLSS